MNMLFKTALAIAVSASAVNLAQAADYNMRLSHQLPASHHVAKALEEFAVEAEKNTGGRLDVQIFGGEQLYKASQNHVAVARGQVEAASILSLQWGGTIPEMQVFSIPYLMTRPEQLEKFPGSPAAMLLEDKLQKKGVKSIAWLLDANDSTFTSQKAPLVAPADFKGVKIRGLGRLVDTGFIAMGAAPSTMPGSEVYQGLQTGVIDAGVTSLSAVYARRYYEVQKYAVVTPLIAVYQNLVVNPRWWQGLPEEVRSGVLAAAKKAEVGLAAQGADQDPEGVAKLEQTGMSVTVHTPEQRKALEQAMQPVVVEEFMKTTADAQKLLDLVRQL